MFSFRTLLLLRLLEAVLLRTSFNPDEHWQANEVAHSLAFGDTVSPKALLTWEWLEPAEIRGWAHPMIFAGLFKLLAIVGLDSRWLVAWSPRCLQAVIAASGDVAIGKLGGSAAQWLQMTNWFMAFCLPRTYSNSLECVLFTWCLVVYMVRKDGVGTFILAALTLLMRPTAAVMFVPIGVHHLFVRKARLLDIIYGAVVYLFLTLLVDRIGYGHFVFVPWNFFKFNYLQNVSALYGTHPFLWYFYAGMPFMLGPHLVPLLLAVTNKATMKRHSLLIVIFLFSTLVFSLNSHKEFRFLLPLMPIAFVIMADKASRLRLWFARVMIMGNIGMFAFFGLIHQAGPEAVMTELARIQPRSVLFLMDCHQTAFAAHLHGIGVQWLRQLDCSPTSPKPHESTRFSTDPVTFTNEFLAGLNEAPSHIVAFEDRKWNELGPLLEKLGYKTQSVHSHILPILGDERAMIILEKTDPESLVDAPVV